MKVTMIDKMPSWTFTEPAIIAGVYILSIFQISRAVFIRFVPSTAPKACILKEQKHTSLQKNTLNSFANIRTAPNETINTL
jgi:hypothetical protein